MFLIDQFTSTKRLTTYLQKKSTFFKDSEVVKKIEIAGEGNMNVVLRVRTTKQTFILKQSRPFIKKYPHIPAPVNRIEVEQKFYHLMNEHSFFPKVLGYISTDFVLLLEDLVEGEDLISLYQSQDITAALIKDFTLGLYCIHKQNTPFNYPNNSDMRKLNHKHIFVLPFNDNNGFSLDNIQDGLETLATPYRTNNILKKKIQNAGNLYLKKGNTFLHGDYYPGSWMLSRDRFYVIDPEFSFIGPKAFDLGVMSAHLIMASGKASILEKVYKAYPVDVELEQINLYCGIEILRRLIGLAQLPIDRSLKEKKVLLALAEKLILS